MRFKINIERYDKQRVLIYDSHGLSVSNINTINDFCLRNGIRELEFATLADDIVGIVCKPSSWIKIMEWNESVSKKKYPRGFFTSFSKKCHKVLNNESTLEKYVEEITKDEKELSKHLLNKVEEVREENKRTGVDQERAEKLWDKDNQ